MFNLIKNLFANRRGVSRSLSYSESVSYDIQHTSEDGLPFYNLVEVAKNYREKAQQIGYFQQDLIGKGSARYSIGEEIGRGYTSRIYRAYDRNLKRTVALKRFLPEWCPKASENSPGSDTWAMFQISHPHIVDTYDLGFDEKGTFLVMSLIEGMNLKQALEKDELSVDDFSLLAEHCLDGLITCHEEGILHLDLKPANIMLSRTSRGKLRAVLIDFGRARQKRLTNVKDSMRGQRGMLGSIFYMSPEQLTKQPLDERSDLYALGCVFYHILSGRAPFVGKNTAQVILSHLQHKVKPLHKVAKGVSPVMSNWIMKLIQKDPQDRFSSAREALDEFEANVSPSFLS